MLKKPKESASPSPQGFNMHISLRGLEKDGGKEGDLERGEQGGNQYKWRQIRGAPELLSLILNQRGVGLHDSVVRTGKTGEAK